MDSDHNNPTFERIEQEINDHSVVLFMKGTPIFPQCGFSAATVQALSMLGVKFGSVDVLQDMEIRDGIPVGDHPAHDPDDSDLGG